MLKVNVIGAGLAGCEAANFLANHNIKVDLYEKRPKENTPAHKTDLFGELVCSNSLKSIKFGTPSDLLKKEMSLMGSLILESAYINKLDSSESLNVDRIKFAQYITGKIKNNNNITIHYQNLNKLPEGINIICTGPLTSEELLEEIASLTKLKCYSFFDSSAPIIKKSSINFDKFYRKSRYSEDKSYLNSPLTKEEYYKLVDEISNGKKVILHDFETKFFESCLPIDEMARRGKDTLRFGPLKPVGLETDNIKPFAVVQLRQDDLIGDYYNLVGFQNNLTYPEQKRIFRMIPGLENAEFIRYGLMHRNSYLYSPKILDSELRLKVNNNIYIAGQLSGVEGYMESAASGLLAAYYCYLNIKKIEHKPLGFRSILGALIRYITHTGVNNFQPMNANFGLIYKSNLLTNDKIYDNSKEDIDRFIKQVK